MVKSICTEHSRRGGSTIYRYLTESAAREYETLRLLKTSARGSVSLLRNRHSGVRVIFRSYQGSCEVYRRLLPVSCPNLPRILEAAEADGMAAVLEEYVQGDPLSEVLQGVRMTPAEARKIALQLCRALWTLHSLGGIHRDVKPENVLLRGDQAVLIDFDAARVFKKDGGSDTQVLGTTGYAAPEQYGIAQTDGRADIYALGVLLNVMLTGRHPSRELAAGKLGRIVQKCTMVNPKKRYKNVLHLMEALS